MPLQPGNAWADERHRWGERHPYRLFRLRGTRSSQAEYRGL